MSESKRDSTLNGAVFPLHTNAPCGCQYLDCHAYLLLINTLGLISSGGI